MKLIVVADRPLFHGKLSEAIQMSRKKKPINESSKDWWVEKCFEKGYWALCREIDKDKIAEFRFRSIGKSKEIEELKGIIWLGDEKYDEFSFSAIEVEDVKLQK